MKTTPKQPGGRPSLYRAEFGEQMIAAMADGLSAEAAGASIGISVRALHEWQQKHEEFPCARRSIQSSSRSQSTDDPRSSQEPKPNLLTLAHPVGLRPPYTASVKRLSHLDCRAFSR